MHVHECTNPMMHEPPVTSKDNSRNHDATHRTMAWALVGQWASLKRTGKSAVGHSQRSQCRVTHMELTPASCRNKATQTKHIGQTSNNSGNVNCFANLNPINRDNGGYDGC